jgi:hypothetical protein
VTAPRWSRALPLVALALTTLALGVIYRRVFAGELAGDDNTFHWAEVVRISDGLRHGDLDWWNPSANAGFPTGYYYQLLPALAPGALAAIFGHPLFWFQFAIWLPLVLTPAAGYRALRVLDVEPWPAFGGGLAIALTLSNSKWGHGADGVFAVGLFTQVSAFAAFPLALAHGLRWLRAGDHLAPAIAWGAFVGMSHPVAGMALGAALAPLAVTTAIATAAARSPRWRYPAPGSTAVWGPLVRVVVLGAALLVATAAAWAPTVIDYAAFGGFPHRLPDEAGPGFVRLGRWLVGGGFLDHGRTPILTALVPLAIAGAIVDRRGHAVRGLAVAALVIALVIGVGRSLKSADDLFPAIRFMGALQVILAMVAGAGFVTLLQHVVRWADREPYGVVLQGVVGGLTGALLIAIGSATAPTLASRVRLSTDWDTVYRGELAELMPAIAKARPGRLQNRGPENHWAMMLPYLEVDRPQLVAYGGAALQSSPNFVYLWATPPPAKAAWIYDAPLVLTTPARGGEIGGVVLARTAHLELRELPAPGLVGPVQVTGELPPGRTATRAAVLRWQATDEPLHDRVLAHHGHGIAGAPPDGDARAIVRGRSRITATLVARTPTTFAIRESWHPRWRATLDGRPARLRRISPDHLAIDVGPGTHQLVVTFRRPWWTWALWLAWPLVALAAAVAARRRHSGVST